jgi:hypothetical protein
LHFRKWQKQRRNNSDQKTSQNLYYVTSKYLLKLIQNIYIYIFVKTSKKSKSKFGWLRYLFFLRIINDIFLCHINIYSNQSFPFKTKYEIIAHQIKNKNSSMRFIIRLKKSDYVNVFVSPSNTQVAKHILPSILILLALLTIFLSLVLAHKSFWSRL